MDGVTDAAFRYIVDIYGKPSILFTEFTSVEGIVRGAWQLLQSFIYHKTSTPTVAQIFGKEPEAFYKTAILLAEMGFDGIDINMGCPDKNVARHGGGAALILKPQLAKEIICSVKKGLHDWSEGKKVEDLQLPLTITDWVEDFKKKHKIMVERRLLPTSVKTRIGYDKIVTVEWIKSLLEAEPVNITIHGRTLKQLYSGLADWEEIGKAAEVINQTQTSVLGNGDIQNYDEALQKIKQYHLDGVLIGRSSFGNPWIFKNETPSIKQRLEAAIEHIRAFERLTPTLHFLSLRKHMAWYCKGFDNAVVLRKQLMTANTPQEAVLTIQNYMTAKL